MSLLAHPDGRTLEFVTDGPADGTVLILHHGTPGAAVLFEPMVQAAARHGLRTVVYARPGYAGSTAQPGRDVAAAAGDVAVLLDALHADRFVTIGWSGGGPHALACAALLPERCAAAGIIAGVAPYRSPGLDWLADMGEENVEEFSAALAGPAAITELLTAAAGQLAGVRGAEVAAALGGLVTEVDRAALTGELAEYLAAAIRAAVGTGIAGWRDDDLAFTRDWGFALEPGVPTSIWQGGADRMVPYAHGEWLAANLPGATAHLLPAEGHLSLAGNHFDAVVAEVAKALR